MKDTSGGISLNFWETSSFILWTSQEGGVKMAEE